nr:UxaA family hydrolase [uncultured Gellertiella sp.]
MSDPSLLILDASDNIALARRDLVRGTVVTVDGAAITLERDTPTGHKLAIRAIAPGEKVIKYRTPIGSARLAIAPGDYVHIHNLKSDYLPTYTLSGDSKKEA